MIVVIDNYDSFTFNLVQYFQELGADVRVFRNDQTSLQELERCNPTHLVISPGPCTPDEAGISVEAIRHFAGEIPILGVCLGHQAIGQAFGGKIVRAKKPMHGKVSKVNHGNDSIFACVNNPFTATRYHSLVVERSSLPDCLEVTAESEDGEIMGIRHKEYAISGVQFHPESILTEDGRQMMHNFIANA
ncbi:aminodeoxychorismate/anthranilate synthase component II [Fodinisporobacter ferrooxydans]|uniref:Aminodeoxychorismate/anthranilate synthase component II n=1 Tax=Fodinisporobacter ferrooxydans TaxID=2901836 RepID=A0ABY4CF16_9BACL|nr:aminodeoxychorismate/anthranilate synthase component II [Alicyclobacillaceae bacterium MYW30-H2]